MPVTMTAKAGVSNENSKPRNFIVLLARDLCGRIIHTKSPNKNYQANIERDFVHSTLRSRF
jgi:hypothetical protein